MVQELNSEAGSVAAKDVNMQYCTEMSAIKISDFGPCHPATAGGEDLNGACDAALVDERCR
jgi:hypothetical protein